MYKPSFQTNQPARRRFKIKITIQPKNYGSLPYLPIATKKKNNIRKKLRTQKPHSNMFSINNTINFPHYFYTNFTTQDNNNIDIHYNLKGYYNTALIVLNSTRAQVSVAQNPRAHSILFYAKLFGRQPPRKSKKPMCTGLAGLLI